MNEQLFVIRGELQQLRSRETEVNAEAMARSRMVGRSAGTLLTALGESGLGAATSYNSDNTDNMAEEVYCTVNGIAVQGVLKSTAKFENGDQVEAVVCRGWDGQHELYALYCPVRYMLAIAPKCVRGRQAIMKEAKKFWMGWNLVIALPFAIMFFLIAIFDEKSTLTSSLWFSILGGGGLSLFWGLIVFYFMKRDLPTLGVQAERIFATLGWQNVGEIDVESEAQVYFDLIREKEGLPDFDKAEYEFWKEGWVYRHVEPKREAESNTELPQAPSPADAQRDETMV